MSEPEPGKLAKRERDELVERDSGGQALDAYEAEYMPGAGMVLYRDKSRAPNKLHAAFGIAMAATLGLGMLAPGGLVAALVTAPLLLFTWLLFAVLRVSVSEGHVNIQYGVLGPKIPISAIESAEAFDYDWKEFGGWGIRLNAKGEWMYNMPGDGGHAVRIVWRKGDKTRVTCVSSRHAAQLAEQIGRARALAPASSPAALPARKSS